MLRPGEVLLGKYEITKMLGKGGFSEVYQAKGTSEHQKIALKVESSISSFPMTLAHERHILNELADVCGVPHVLFHKSTSKCSVLGLNYLGKDLKGIRKSGLFEPSEPNLILIASLLLTIIEEIHVRGVVHMDIKPDNIVLSHGKRKKLSLIDFGLSEQITYKRGKPAMGSLFFSSINRMEKRTVSVTDDLESWFYTLVYMCKGAVPWEVALDGEMPRERILAMKRSISTEALCEGLPSELKAVHFYLKSLTSPPKAPYTVISAMLQSAASRLHVNLASDSIVLSKKKLMSRSESLVCERRRKRSFMETAATSDEATTPKGKRMEFLPKFTEELRRKLSTTARRMSALM